MAGIYFPKIEITFSPGWWSAKYGMDFSSATDWQDPVRYTARDQEQRRLLFERFGDVGIGEINPQPNPLVGVEYGHRFMSAFWGCEVLYLPGQWPHATPLPDAAERLATLQVPALDGNPAIELARRNARVLEKRYGHVQSAVNFGGPLNNAVSVLGEAIFEACAADPDLAQHVLYRMGEAVLQVHDRLECPINRVPAGQERQKNWGIGNCPVGQISPVMYQEVVLPVDFWFRRAFTGSDFALHHCGIFHPYAGVYQVIEPSDLDVGPGSDLRRTRQTYPRARISAYIEPSQFDHLDQAQIDACVAQILEDAAPLELITYIRAIEVGPELSDEAVRLLMTVQQRLFPQNQAPS
jgi:hypothetical protein